MAIKYRSSWNHSPEEALVQFEFLNDRGASGTAQTLVPRSVMSLTEQQQAEEAFKRFLEIHAADLATDERLKQQQGMTEVTSKALLELTLNVLSLQSEVAGLKQQVSDLQVPEEPTEEETQETDEDPEETEEPNEIIDEV